MNKLSMMITGILLAIVATVNASLTLLPPGPMVGSHVGNLVVGGSFEAGPPSAIPFWAVGTSSTPVATPPGWTGIGPAINYARWGNDNLAPPSIVGSARFPHGIKGLYFGNAQSATLNMAPTFNANGEVTFPGSPTVSNGVGGPVVLSQTVNTHLSPAPSYILSFWASGEAAFAGGAIDGIFGFRLTNTELGDPFHYLTAPGGSGSSLLGSEHRYELAFTPINSSLPVTVEFYNWGHFGFGGGTTELVLDDVIVNPILPEPAALGLLGIGSIFVLRRNRKI